MPPHGRAARPSLLYVMSTMILLSVSMDLIAALAPKMATNVAQVYLFARKVAKIDIPIADGFVADVAVCPCATGGANRLNVNVVAISV